MKNMKNIKEMKKVVQNAFSMAGFSILFKPLKKALTSTLMLLLSFGFAAASSTGSGQFGWEKVLKTIADSISGPVAYSIGIITIAISGFAIAFLDLQGGAKWFVRVLCGLSIVFTATSLLSTFGWTSGAMIF
ncbi:TrbC/VirB2 family protein [Cysteiniphilum litorale]|nr:TrbC/VirB2 family protein [Cysteiniphilum litorale]